MVFDKFVANEAAGPSPLRRLLNRAAVRLGTDLTRRLGDLLAGSELVVVADAPAMLGGAYRIVRLERRDREERPTRRHYPPAYTDPK